MIIVSCILVIIEKLLQIYTMLIYYVIAIFILGLVIGSFLNVVIFRVDNLKTIVNSRSYCPSCKHTLGWLDLIPLFSFIFLGGKCRYCKNKISIQYPLVELGMGLVYVLLFFQSGLTLALAYYLIIFSILCVVFVYDLKTQYVIESFVWAALILSLLGSWYFGGLGFWNMILGGLIGGGIPAILVGVSREKWMGAGDIKIGLILGLILGYPVAIFGIFLAFILGSIAGLIYMKFANKTIKDSLPFAPFLITASLISLIFGQAVINWYTGSFF